MYDYIVTTHGPAGRTECLLTSEWDTANRFAHALALEQGEARLETWVPGGTEPSEVNVFRRIGDEVCRF